MNGSGGRAGYPRNKTARGGATKKFVLHVVAHNVCALKNREGGLAGYLMEGIP